MCICLYTFGRAVQIEKEFKEGVGMKQQPLKVERELRGWSQAKVAEALNTTVRTISRWEQGQALPYPYYRERMCELFGKDARQLGLLPEREEVVVSPLPDDPLSHQKSSQASLSLLSSEVVGATLKVGVGLPLRLDDPT